MGRRMAGETYSAITISCKLNWALLCTTRTANIHNWIAY